MFLLIPYYPNRTKSLSVDCKNRKLDILSKNKHLTPHHNYCMREADDVFGISQLLDVPTATRSTLLGNRGQMLLVFYFPRLLLMMGRRHQEVRRKVRIALLSSYLTRDLAQMIVVVVLLHSGRSRENIFCFTFFCNPVLTSFSISEKFIYRLILIK